MFVGLLSPHENRSSVAAGLLSVLLTGKSIVFLNEGMHPTVVVECSAFKQANQTWSPIGPSIKSRHKVEQCLGTLPSLGSLPTSKPLFLPEMRHFPHASSHTAVLSHSFRELPLQLSCSATSDHVVPKAYIIFVLLSVKLKCPSLSLCVFPP